MACGCGFNDVLRPDHIGLERLVRLILADGHMLQGSQMKYIIHSPAGCGQRLPVPDIPDYKGQTGVLKLTAHGDLGRLAAREDDDLLRALLQQLPD
ncbi:hypothetical protein D3C71_1788560 [compost metagenome]